MTLPIRDGDRLLTTREVGELLGLSPEAVLRRWRAGDLPGFRLSRKALRFREAEVLAWLEGHREGPRPAVVPVVGLRVIASDEEEVDDARQAEGLGSEA